MRAQTRQATDVDHASLEALQRRASLATGEHAGQLLANPDAFEIPTAHLAHSLVAELDGQLVGFCTVLPTSPGFAEVEAVFIDPGAWRKGIGALLLLEAERRVASAGATTIEVISGEYAEPFYKALGFVPSGTAVTRFGPAMRLMKEIV